MPYGYRKFESYTFRFIDGEMVEWLIALVLKTRILEMVSQVRILLSPIYIQNCISWDNAYVVDCTYIKTKSYGAKNVENVWMKNSDERLVVHSNTTLNEILNTKSNLLFCLLFKMAKLTNLFEDFRRYQWRKVGSPLYEPLGQAILTSDVSEEELKKQKRTEYHKNYYEKNKERIKEYNRNYWKKTHMSSSPKDELSWFQKKVYDYLLNQYRKWEEPARWTEIARALGISENSVYTAVFQLTKKWYLGRWTYGKYLLLKFPSSEKSNRDETITYEDIESTHKTLVWRWYLDELADKISAWLVSQNKELYEENQRLKETLNKIKEAWMEHEKSVDVYYKQWQDSYSDLDSIIMNR